MASKIDRPYFLLRSRQKEYERREQRMLDWLRDRLDAHCYVSWSAGKDSMVVAHAVQRVTPTPVLMVDPGVPIHWTEDDRGKMIAYATEQSWALRVFPWDKFATRTADNEADYRNQIHASMFVDLTAHAELHGLTRRITGIRAAESKTRHRFLAATRGQTKHTLQPLWDWTTEDVWTYTMRHGLPWLSVYDHLGPHARNGLIGKNGREHGRLAFLKLHYPAAFRRASELFEVRDYV